MGYSPSKFIVSNSTPNDLTLCLVQLAGGTSFTTSPGNISSNSILKFSTKWTNTTCNTKSIFLWRYKLKDRNIYFGLLMYMPNAGWNRFSVAVFEKAPPQWSGCLGSLTGEGNFSVVLDGVPDCAIKNDFDESSLKLDSTLLKISICCANPDEPSVHRWQYKIDIVAVDLQKKKMEDINLKLDNNDKRKLLVDPTSTTLILNGLQIKEPREDTILKKT